MQINLPLKSFSFFKILTAFIFLIFAVLFPVIASISFLIALAVGRAHGIGAWISMWKRGKLNWRYTVSIFFIMLGVSFWGFQLVNLETLSFVTYSLFIFHFIFDEHTLQEGDHTDISSLISSGSPFIIFTLLLLQNFTILTPPISIFFLIAGMLFCIEMLYLKKIDWFFVHNKTLLVYGLIAALLKIPASSVLAILLIFHYFFWFIYPVYKLHKYKREERDELIMILIIIVGTSLYFAATKSSLTPETYELGVKTFLVGTIVHILSTAPFWYLFGMKKS